jgi:hypothetical protein
MVWAKIDLLLRRLASQYGVLFAKISAYPRHRAPSQKKVIYLMFGSSLIWHKNNCFARMSTVLRPWCPSLQDERAVYNFTARRKRKIIVTAGGRGREGGVHMRC